MEIHLAVWMQFWFLGLNSQFSIVVAVTDASVMILLWKACCTWKVATALMSNVLKYNISSLSEGESPHSFILFWLKHGVHYNSFLIFSPIVWGHPVSPRQSSVITQHTDCNLLSSVQIHPIQYQWPLLLFQKMWFLIGDAALSETGVFSFPLHSKLSISAGQQQTCKHWNFLIFVFVVFIALGFFPSPSSPDTFTGSEVSTALSLMDPLSSTEFKAGSDTGEPEVCWLAQFVLIPAFLSNFGGVCRPDWFISPPQALA